MTNRSENLYPHSIRDVVRHALNVRNKKMEDRLRQRFAYRILNDWYPELSRRGQYIVTEKYGGTTYMFNTAGRDRLSEIMQSEEDVIEFNRDNPDPIQEALAEYRAAQETTEIPDEVQVEDVTPDPAPASPWSPDGGYDNHPGYTYEGPPIDQRYFVLSGALIRDSVRQYASKLGLGVRGVELARSDNGEFTARIDLDG